MRPMPSLATLAAIFIAGALGKVWLNGGFGNGDAPISLSKHNEIETRDVGMREYGYGLKVPLQETSTGEVLTIAARKEKVTIRKVILNRGNCDYVFANILMAIGAAKQDAPQPFEMRFGETVDLYPRCKVIEANIDTDKGSFAFGFGSE